MATAKKAPAKKAPASKAAPAKKVAANTAAPATKLWVYIKAHNLQDSANKRMINADNKLRAVFGKAQVSMFEMAGLIGKHVK